MRKTSYRYMLPCHITIGANKRKRLSLNLNQYRNTHYQVLAKMKREFSPIGDYELFVANKIKIKYILHHKTRRKTDLMNWVSICDKFFLDWLVSNGCIPDDAIRYCDDIHAISRYDETISDMYIEAIVTIL